MLETYLITNGRSTFNYALKFLRAQEREVKINVIGGAEWVKANNRALREGKASLYFRVDDDMFLHPLALQFMEDTYDDSTCHTAKLYEHFTKRVAGKIRLYNRYQIMSRIKEFRPNKLGKIDRTFEADVKNDDRCEITTADKHSPVGLHACAPWREQLKYEELWGYKKSTREFMMRYSKSVEWQAENAVRIIERYNSRNNTKFWKYICAHKNKSA